MKTARFKIAAALATLAFAACTDSTPTDPASKDMASVRVSANVAGTPISVLVVTVTGAGIPTPLIFNLTVSNSFASGEVKVPAGDARTFSVQAFDSEGEVTHEGSKVVDIKRGKNPPISIPLTPRDGQQPITVTMGDFAIQITPASQTLSIAGTVTLTAIVTAPNGDHPDPTVAWATVDPSIATVDVSTGLVRAKRAGSTSIIATYGGVAASMSLVVTDQTQPISIQGPVFPGPTGFTFVTFQAAPGDGTEMGHAGGRVNTYRNFDVTNTRFLAFGVNMNDMPALAMNGAPQGHEIDPTSRMTFSIDCSMALQALCYLGTTHIPLATGGQANAFTRFTLTVSVSINGAPDAPADLSIADPAFSTVGGWSRITTSLSGPSDAFHARLKFEASADGVDWRPALDFFQLFQVQKVPGTETRMSFTGALYYAF